jgi:hypothetical protein
MTTIDTLLQQEHFDGSADVADLRAKLTEFMHGAMTTAT